jgi:hypothetical protein
MNQQLLERLTSGDQLMWVLGAGIAIVAITGSTIRAVVSSISRERSRREIAAYIAEGSISPEQGAKLMAATEPRKSC